MIPANPSEWKETVIHLFALAARLEGEGQYNLAKLARAAADSLCRREAYLLPVPGERAALSEQVNIAAFNLDVLQANPKLSAALKKGAEILASGGLPQIEDTPHPYVCRTCGRLELQAPVENCPTCGAWPGSFQRFLPVYWLEAYEPFAAIERLQKTPTEVELLLAGLPESALEQPAVDGGWSIRSALTHLRDAQGVLAFRVDLFINEERPLLESKAVFAWATKQEGSPEPARVIFEAYLADRRDTLRKLELLPIGYWWRKGQHQEFGEVSLKQQASYFAAHELTHLPQISKLRRQILGE